MIFSQENQLSQITSSLSIKYAQCDVRRCGLHYRICCLNVTYVPFNIFTVKIPIQNGETTPHKPT